MAIDIRIDGDPQEIRAAGGWLRSRLSAAVDECNSSNHRARCGSETEWIGTAGDSFRGTLNGVAPEVDELAADIDGVGRSFERYAGELHTAQEGMRRARSIAERAGLHVTGSLILDPGPAPGTPKPLPAEASPRMVRAHEQAVSAQQAHAARVRAYTEAQQEADKARSLWRWARDTAREYWSNLWGKRYLNISSFTSGAAGATFTGYESSLTKSVAEFDEEIDNLLKARRGTEFASAARRHIDNRIDNVAVKIARTQVTAGTVARYSRAAPVVGLVITAIGVGMDVRSGKPPGKVLFSAAVSTIASTVVAAALVGSAPVAVTALAAVAVGVGAGMAATWAYEEFLSQDTKEWIDDGFDTVAEYLQPVTDPIDDTLSKAWNTVF